MKNTLLTKAFIGKEYKSRNGVKTNAIIIDVTLERVVIEFGTKNTETMSHSKFHNEFTSARPSGLGF
jgi:hypothetical protein